LRRQTCWQTGYRVNRPNGEIAALLQENSAGSSWEKAGETSTQVSYIRKDGHASAQTAKLNEAGSGRIKLTFNGAELIVKSSGQ
jgi:hypothetical protein